METNSLPAPGSEDLDDRACRSGRSASSAPPEEPHQDKRSHRDHKARRRAGYAVNEISGRGPEQRTEHDGQLRNVHDTPTQQAAFQGSDRLFLADLRGAACEAR